MPTLATKKAPIAPRSRSAVAPVDTALVSAQKVLKEQTGIDFLIVNVDDLVANNYNPNAMEQQVFDSLAEQMTEAGGVAQTVIVRPLDGKPGKYEIVDGEHRVKTAAIAGIKRILVANVPLSDGQAKLKTLSMNHLRGQDLPIKLAQLLVSLNREYTVEEIARLTGIKAEAQISVTKLLDVPDFTGMGDSVTPIGAEEAARPISVNLLLMPDEHGPYEQAMNKAMGLAGASVTPLVGEEAIDYGKAMKESMGLIGVKMRNVALAAICETFNELPESLKEAVAGRIRERIGVKLGKPKTGKKGKKAVSDTPPAGDDDGED